MNATAVQPEDIGAWKDRLSWHFESFCRDGSLYPSDLWADIAAKERQLWVLEDETQVLVAVLTLINRDRHHTFDVTHGAGKNMMQWQHLFPALQHCAREIGCKRIRVVGRLGWERILPLKKTHVILEGWL